MRSPDQALVPEKVITRCVHVLRAGFGIPRNVQEFIVPLRLCTTAKSEVRIYASISSILPDPLVNTILRLAIVCGYIHTAKVYPVVNQRLFILGNSIHHPNDQPPRSYAPSRIPPPVRLIVVHLVSA